MNAIATAAPSSGIPSPQALAPQESPAADLAAAQSRIRLLEGTLRTVLRTLETPCAAIVDVVWAQGEICTTLFDLCAGALDGEVRTDLQLGLPGVPGAAPAGRGGRA
ncbi:MAG: hypothetical protein E6Q67_03285 [Roseateles sp.]|nr:MAG: hypothetical protein E6Q67_03285 [Roseateles sp.]